MKLITIENYALNTESIIALEKKEFGTRIYVRLSFDKEYIDTVMPYESVRGMMTSKDGFVPDANTALLKSLVEGQQSTLI